MQANMTSKTKPSPRSYSFRKPRGKVLAATLYTYVRKQNNDWVRAQSRKLGVPYSVFVDQLLTRARTGARPMVRAA